MLGYIALPGPYICRAYCAPQLASHDTQKLIWKLSCAQARILWFEVCLPRSPHTPERGNWGEEEEEEGSLRLDPAYGVLVQALLCALEPLAPMALDRANGVPSWHCGA